jgi:hypothetical protein
MRFARLFRPCCALLGAALAVLVPRPARAQQDMFNVPTGTITPRGQIYFQNQLEFGETAESELTLDFGLGKGFEVGMNIRELVLYPGEFVWSFKW